MAIRKTIVVNGVLVLISIICGFTIMEVYLRIDNWRPPVKWANVEFNGRTYKFHEVPEKFNDIKGSVVFLGDSMTVGGACGLERNYPAVFGRLARDRYGYQQSLNIAVSGTNSFHYVTVAKDLLALNDKPAGGIVTLFANDIEYDCSLCNYMMDISNSGEFSEDEFRTLKKLCGVCRLNNYDPTQLHKQTAHFNFVRKAHRLMYRESYVYRFARRAIISAFNMIGMPVGWGSVYKEQWRNHASLQFRLVKLSMKLLQSEFEKANVPLLVVIYPHVGRINEQNDYVRLYSDAGKFLSESTGVTVLSGYPAFFENEHSQEDMRYSLTDGHPNCQAHEVFATWVLDTWVLGKEAPVGVK